MKLRQPPQFTFRLGLGIGALIALILCIQCVRTYWYTDAVLIPQQAEHEAERQAGAVTAAARSAGVANPKSLEPVLGRAWDTTSDHVFWIRVLDLEGHVLAQAGNPEGTPRFPARWWNRVEKHESLGTVLDTLRGKALVVTLPLRLGHPPRSPQDTRSNEQFSSPPGTSEIPHPGYALEVSVSLKAVAGTFAGLRENLIVGVIAALALLLAVTVIGLRAPHYFRGRYLESELQLAKRVQSDLQPNPQSVSPHVAFAAWAVAADHVGGDFFDVFEAQPGHVAIVLGEVSGKGISAALLVSVLQGAIRSSTALQHESACEQINRMLCERTACERFATLFWGVFDAATGMLRYVNAGHLAPMLVRLGGTIERLHEGGPVLGMLPNAHFSAGKISVQEGDKLVVFSDGLTEAADHNDQEFGEARIAAILADGSSERAEALCGRIGDGVKAFANGQAAGDDRTLVVLEFSRSNTAASNWTREEVVTVA